jgi:hypothetical protein
VATPDSTSILNMTSDIFGLDFTRDDSIYYKYAHMISYIFGLDLTCGDCIFCKYCILNMRSDIFGLDFIRGTTKHEV